MPRDPELLHLTDDGSIPNNPRLPALLWRGALAADAGPESAEALFARHGWPPAWRNGIHAWQHFHPNAHEALAIVAGRVTVQLGGGTGPVLELAAGDIVALPAGVGHCRLSGDAGLLVVGAYPAGSEPQQSRAAMEPLAHARAVAAVAATLDPPCEPVGGGAWPVGGA